MEGFEKLKWLQIYSLKFLIPCVLSSFIMKTIGLIGGMSWESSIEYYRLLNELTKKRLGGLHSAKIILYSVDFAPIENWMRNEQWDLILQELTHASQQLEKSGADFILICTNTMHKLMDQMQEKI